MVRHGLDAEQCGWFLTMKNSIAAINAALAMAGGSLNDWMKPREFHFRWGGHTKAEWMKPSNRPSRFKNDSKHRKAVLGRRANVQRMKALKRLGKPIWGSHSKRHQRWYV